MSANPPIIYLLAGEDEFAISQYLSVLESRLGDATTVSMNLTRLDGRTYNLDELLSIAGAAPFLARRRLVILTNPTARISSEDGHTKFFRILEKIPQSTALVLVEYRQLTRKKDRKSGRLHWLERWAVDHEEIALFTEFPLPDRVGMQRWIEGQARHYGGQITPEAAWRLEELVGTNKRLADQEILKLLAYTNYQHPIQDEDVALLVANAGQNTVFELVDAVGSGDRYGAVAVLRRLLEQQDPGAIFGMLVRQYRMLLIGREILDAGGGSQQLAEHLKIQPFLANKILAQVRRFNLSGLEAAYHCLLEADERVKSGEMPADLSIEVLVVELTGSIPFTPIQK